MQEHGPYLVTMLWRILGNEADVCDAYQDTFLHLTYHFEQRRRPRHIRNYLYRTALNTALSMLRRRRLQQTMQETLRKECFESVTTDYAADLDSRALQQTLRESISRLPEPLADVIVLRDLAQLPYSEVGQILGIRPGTARVYRHKAVQALASLMAQKDRQVEL
jgi:RNA polymerase sigma-70 factor (ECF subfamily)